MEIIQKHSAKGTHYQEQAVFEELCDIDPALSLFGKIDRDIQSREKYFCLNSIRGMYGYFNS
jgi:hypothetical protein